MVYHYVLLALVALVLIHHPVQADERARCGKSILCSVENARPPFVLRNLPMPDGIQPGRLPVLLNTFSEEQIVDVTFTPEALMQLQLLTERWLQQHTAIPVLQSPAMHNQHYPGLQLVHNTEERVNYLLAWGASTAFTEALMQQPQSQKTDSLLLLFIGRNTQLPQGSIPPYLTKSSWQGRGQQAQLGTEFFESLAYQAVLINRQGEVILAATEGFKAGSNLVDDGFLWASLARSGDRRIQYLLNQQDLRQSIDECEQDSTCPAYQALARLLENLRLVNRESQL